MSEIMRLYGYNENEDENEKKSLRYDTNDLGLDMDTNIVNIRSITIWWCLYVLSNI